MLAFSTGLLMGLGLIAAIGAQNLYVIRRGVEGRAGLLVAAVSAAADAALILLGVCGAGTVVASAGPVAAAAVGALGSAFLLHQAKQALVPGEVEVSDDAPAGPRSSSRLVAETLAYTLLNPHVYLDTVVLLGGTGAQYEPIPRAMFAAGATSASVIWFFGLAITAAWFGPVLMKPRVRRMFDIGSGLVLGAMGVALALWVGKHIL